MENDLYIWELAYVFEKRPKYLGNDVDLWEMAQIWGEWLNYLSIFLKFGKWHRDLGNGQNIWDMA